MKKLNKLTALAIALAVFFSACKEDEIMENNSDPTSGTTTVPEEYSSYTVEQNKSNLEDNGIELISEVESIKDEPGLAASASFAYWMSVSSEAPANGRMLMTAKTLQKFEAGDASIKDVFTSLRTSSEEPASIQEYYDQHTGIYAWNQATQKWDYDSNSDQIVFEFPSTEGGTSNNASLIIHSYEGIDAPSPISSEYDGDLPTKLVTELKVDGTQVAVYSFSATYSSNGDPSSMLSTLALQNYTFAFEAKNDTENIGAAYSLTKGNKVLISMGTGAKGTFTTENIQEVTSNHNATPGDLADEANAYFQVMDIMIAGKMDIKTMVDKGMFEDDDEDVVMEGDGTIIEEEEDGFDAYEEADILNETVQLTVFYVSEQQKIAESEFYASEHSYTYNTYVYNEETQSWEIQEIEENYTSVDIRFVFADETKSDLATYFGEGFEELTGELSRFIRSIEG